jgi:hypothetical protein
LAVPPSAAGDSVGELTLGAHWIRRSRFFAARRRATLGSEVDKVPHAKLHRLIPAVVIVFAVGCASYSSMKEARTLDPGALRVDVVGGATTARPVSGATAFPGGGRPNPGDTTEQANITPGLEAQVRYGLVQGFDLGLKTSLSSLELNGTVQLMRAEHFDIALAPAIQGALGTNGDDEGWQMVLAKLALLGDARFGASGKHAVVIGPTLAKAWGSGVSKNSGYALDALFAGGTLGVSFEVTRGLRLFPEIAIYTPLTGHGVALPGDVVRVTPDVGPGRPVLVLVAVGVAASTRSPSAP